MGNSLGGPRGWVGQGIRKSPGQGDRMNLVDRDSDMVPAWQLYKGEDSEKVQWPLPALLSVRKLPFQLSL